MNTAQHTSKSKAEDSHKERFSPLQVHFPCSHYPSSHTSSSKYTQLISHSRTLSLPTPPPPPEPLHQTPQLSHRPPYQQHRQTLPLPAQDKFSHADMIGATTGGLPIHLLGAGILSATGGAVAGAAGAENISKYVEFLLQSLIGDLCVVGERGRRSSSRARLDFRPTRPMSTRQ